MQRFEPDDIYLHHSITSVHCVPALGVAACTVLSQDRDKDKHRSAIWSVPLDAGARPEQITSGTDDDTDAKWSPDGSRLAFISDRAGTPQIFLRSGPNGDSMKISAFAGTVASFQWSPCGKKLLVTGGRIR